MGSTDEIGSSRKNIPYGAPEFPIIPGFFSLVPASNTGDRARVRCSAEQFLFVGLAVRGRCGDHFSFATRFSAHGERRKKQRLNH